MQRSALRPGLHGLDDIIVKQADQIARAGPKDGDDHCFTWEMALRSDHPGAHSSAVPANRLTRTAGHSLKTPTGSSNSFIRRSSGANVVAGRDRLAGSAGPMRLERFMKRTILAAVGLALALTTSGYASAQPAPYVSPLSIGPHELVVGNVRLWYRVAGRTSGIPLVFLHGGPGEGSQTFQAFGGPLLERTQRLVYLDQRGGGHSARPRDPANYSLDIMIDDVERLREHLGVDRIALLGHSFGTMVALEYAARYPRHTAALVLASATPDAPRSLDLQCARLARDDPAAYARAIRGFHAGAFPRCDMMQAYAGLAASLFATRNLFPSRATAQRVDALDGTAEFRNSGEALGALLQQGLFQYRFARVEQVLAPVLVIAGGRDFDAMVEPQRDLARALPNGRFLEYPTNGHFMFVEEPARFAADVTAFLRRVGR
jgi:proline iminopeptidase